jgi:hypothetical protein
MIPPDGETDEHSAPPDARSPNNGGVNLRSAVVVDKHSLREKMMIRCCIILLLFLIYSNFVGALPVKAEVIARNTVGCKNWEYLMEVIWLMSLDKNGQRDILPKNVSADEWIRSGRCTWFTKGTIVTIVDVLPLNAIQARPSGSLLEYILPADALTPSSSE